MRIGFALGNKNVSVSSCGGFARCPRFNDVIFEAVMFVFAFLLESFCVVSPMFFVHFDEFSCNRIPKRLCYS